MKINVIYSAPTDREKALSSYVSSNISTLYISAQLLSSAGRMKVKEAARYIYYLFSYYLTVDTNRLLLDLESPPNSRLKDLPQNLVVRDAVELAKALGIPRVLLVDVDARLVGDVKGEVILVNRKLFPRCRKYVLFYEGRAVEFDDEISLLNTPFFYEFIVENATPEAEAELENRLGVTLEREGNELRFTTSFTSASSVREILGETGLEFYENPSDKKLRDVIEVVEELDQTP